MISIIIATYNSEKTIQRCLDSIYEQDFSDAQVIIKDGGSKDQTLSIISSHPLKTNLVSARDSGVYDAWNQCIKKVSGDWVTFLGSDDFFYNDHTLKDLVQHLNTANSNSIHIVYGKNLLIDGDGLPIKIVGDAWNIAIKKIHTQMSIRHPGCFYHSTLLSKVGEFDASYKIAGDHHYTLKCLEHTGAYFYDFVGVVHQIGGISTDLNRISDLIFETYKIRKDLKLKPYIKFDELLFKRLALYISVKFIGVERTKKLFLDR